MTKSSANARETDWSSYGYIFNKKWNKLHYEAAEKLVYVHGNLTNLTNNTAGSSVSTHGSSVSAHFDLTESESIDIDEIESDAEIINIPDFDFGFGIWQWPDRTVNDF